MWVSAIAVGCALLLYLTDRHRTDVHGVVEHGRVEQAPVLRTLRDVVESTTSPTAVVSLPSPTLPPIIVWTSPPVSSPIIKRLHWPVARLYIEPDDGRLDIVIMWTNVTNTTTIGSNRVREWGEMRYGLQLLKKHAVNVRRVIIVCNRGIRPYYQHEFTPWVQFIDIESFMFTWRHTINSHTIQWHLDHLIRIHNLTDPVIMLNDDYLVTSSFDVVDYANQRRWLQESYGSDWGYGNPGKLGVDISVEAIGTVNRAWRDFTQGDHKPVNVVAHVPIVVHSATIGFVRDNFKLEESLSLRRAPTDFQFEYMLALVETNLMGAHFVYAGPYRTFVMMKAPMAVLTATLCDVRNDHRQFIALNDDIENVYLPAHTVPEFRRVITAFLEAIVAGQPC